MKLSKVERLMLLNQFKILEKLSPEEGHYSISKSILENGYAHDYGMVFEELSEEMPEENSKEVWGVLQMYRSLKSSFKNLKDKEGLSEDDVSFEGFDGNDETEHMLYAKFILHGIGRFDESKSNDDYPDYNTHYPKVSKYRRMLRVWESISERYNSNLTAEQIKQIINA